MSFVIVMQTLEDKKDEPVSPARAQRGEVVWEAHYSDEYQRTYYYNTTTGESLWDTPTAGRVVDGSQLDQRDQTQTQDARTDRQSAAEPLTRVNYADSPKQTPRPVTSIRASKSTSNSEQRPQLNDQRHSSAEDNRTNYRNDRGHNDNSVNSESQATRNLLSPSSAERGGDARPAAVRSQQGTVDNNKKKNIAERSADLLQNKKEKEESMRQFFEQKTLEQVRPTPVITAKSKQLNRNVNDMLAWDESRKAKIESLKQMHEQQLEKEMTGKPAIKRVGGTESTKLGASRTSAGQSAAPVHERLMEYEEQRRLKQQYLQMKADQEARVNAVPRISANPNVSNGSNVKNSVPVQERLYSMANKPRHFDDEGLNSGPSSASSAVYHDPQTGQRLFQPKINKVSEKIVNKARPKVAIEDLLHYKQQEYVEKAKARELRKELQEQMLRETPKISSNSERILSEKQQYSLDDNVSNVDRLYSRGIGAVKQRVLETIDQPTFKPTISKKSKEMVSNSMHLYGYGAAGESRRSSEHLNRAGRQANGEVFYAASLIDEDSPGSHRISHHDDGFDGFPTRYGAGDDEDIGENNDEENNERYPLGEYDNMDDATISLEQLAFDDAASYNSGHSRQRNHSHRNEDRREGNSNYYLDYELPHSQSRYDCPQEYSRDDISSNDPGFYSRSMRWQQEKEEKLERERRQKDLEDISKCSFRPNLDGSAFAGQHSGKGPASAESIMDRQSAWVEKRYSINFLG
jgi:hypothetical protein